jgi:hypothetical protein
MVKKLKRAGVFTPFLRLGVKKCDWFLSVIHRNIKGALKILDIAE